MYPHYGPVSGEDRSTNYTDWWGNPILVHVWLSINCCEGKWSPKSSPRSVSSWRRLPGHLVWRIHYKREFSQQCVFLSWLLRSENLVLLLTSVRPKLFLPHVNIILVKTLTARRSPQVKPRETIQVAKRRYEWEWKENGRRMEGEWKGNGIRMEGEWKQNGRGMEGEWKENGRRME